METESKRHGTDRPAAKIEGHCNCGKTSVVVAEPAFLGASSALCHCRNCRASCGSLFSYNLILKTEEVRVEGPTSIYRDTKTDSGNTACRQFCNNCGSPIQTWIEENPEQTFVKGGLFPEQDLPQPALEIFKRNFEKWEKPCEGAQLS